MTQFSLTAGFGLLVAYLINRQKFAGKGAFEFVTLLSFAMPGTVVGIAYILAGTASTVGRHSVQPAPSLVSKPPRPGGAY